MSPLRLFACLLASATGVCAQADLPSIADKTKGLMRRDGLLDSYLDARSATLYLVVPAPDSKLGTTGEYLYLEGLRSGVGSTELGLDRGQPGDSYVVRFRPIGERVLLEAPNFGFRATGSPEEQASVEQSFASSVLFSFKAVARDSDGRTLVDATPFVVRDSHGAARKLGYALDPERSALDISACKSFPENLEFQALLTFAGPRPSPTFGSIPPDARSVSITEHQSLVRLPAAGFLPRKFDPRAGGFAASYLDFSAPLGQPTLKQFILRHRLEKTDPTAARSTVKQPIVYYIDRAAPEPIRTALMEGARFWQGAFERAGFIDAYRVEVMPEGADPEDLRYNVVQWVHRTTRGYSIGNAVTDPRTGEILQGRVTLDSSRGRQDSLLFEGLVGADLTGKGGPNDPVRTALARLRQLAAHEIGHTLGFAHNFAASTYGRASVMDYPAPLIRLKGEEFDFSDAYTARGGDWDDLAVQYAYSEFAPGTDEDRALNDLLAAGIKRGLVFLTDEDADETSGADWRAVRFDNGSDPVRYLKQTLAIRRLGLAKFGERNIAMGRPIGLLEDVLGPLYFFHRYAVDGAVRLVGGLEYTNALRGDGQTPVKSIPAERQVAALDGLLDCIQPEVLDIPGPVLALLPPRPNGFSPSREQFSSTTAFAFDSLGAANTAADLVVARLLDPQRCQRIVEMSTRDASLPTLESVLQRILDRTFWISGAVGNREREIRMGVQDTVLARLFDLADAGTPAVQQRVRASLVAIVNRLKPSTSPRSIDVVREIRQFLSRPATAPARVPAALPPLPGAPIGSCG